MAMTVNDLRMALENVPGELKVIVYSTEEYDSSADDTSTVCPLMEADQQEDEEGEPFFMLTADNSESFENEEEDEEEEKDDEYYNNGTNDPRAHD